MITDPARLLAPGAPPMLALPARVPSRLPLDTVVVSDALAFLRGLPDTSVDLIATDPPYHGVKDEDWDNQWATDADYLAWLTQHLKEFRRILKANGSLYVFASPRMAARVEIAVGEQFNVINRITWQKPPFSTKAEMFDKDTMRGFFPASEAIIFAEQYGSDKPYNEALIDGNSTYWSACESTKRSIFGDYLKIEFNRAGKTNRQIAALFPSATGGLTGCVSNWLLGYNCPTPDQYAKMRDYLNRSGGEYLRAEYEELRAEYEELRRPFNITADDAYTDVWTFRTVNTYPGKHPCEKPLDLMQHIVRASSREGGIVLDCFCGSGATLAAARNLKRHYIGCDASDHWVNESRKRLRTTFEPHHVIKETKLDDLPLFAQGATHD